MSSLRNWISKRPAAIYRFCFGFFFGGCRTGGRADAQLAPTLCMLAVCCRSLCYKGALWHRPASIVPCTCEKTSMFPLLQWWWWWWWATTVWWSVRSTTTVMTTAKERNRWTRHPHLQSLHPKPPHPNLRPLPQRLLRPHPPVSHPAETLMASTDT